MKKSKPRSKLFTATLLTIILGILLPTAEGFSQNFLRINSEGGSSGGTTAPVDNGTDNTTLYVVGALIVSGIIVYAIMKKNKDKSDTTETKKQSSLLIQSNSLENFSTKLQKAKESIPVDLILGIRNETVFISEKTYLLGVSVRF